jgi:hypothetical protein
LKRILIPAGGAVLATGLLAAGLAGTASAASDVAKDELATSAANANAIAQFWAENNGAALKAATESNVWDKTDVAKLQTKGGATTDTKPGSTAPIGEEKKAAAKVQNVNMPKTIGKVFFVNSKGEKKWCSATSIQSKYRNLVATAGHCVYDTGANRDVMDKWVFVPGYYQGKAPWGIYVGKTAFTHYDFDVYEDYDRDYAFVTVYNGVKVDGSEKSTNVSKAEWDKYTGLKGAKDVEISKEEFLKGKLDPTSTESFWVKRGSAPEATGPDYPGAEVGKVEVSEAQYKRAGIGKGNGRKFGEPVTEVVTANEASAYKAKQRRNPRQYPAKVEKDRRGNWTITHFYVQQWYKPGTDTKYFKTVFYIIDHKSLDAGRLGDNVGGQGFAWNQPTGKAVRLPGRCAPRRQQELHRHYSEVVLRQDHQEAGRFCCQEDRGARRPQVRHDRGRRRWSVAVQLQQRQASRLRERCHQHLQRPGRQRPRGLHLVAVLRRRDQHGLQGRGEQLVRQDCLT